MTEARAIEILSRERAMIKADIAQAADTESDWYKGVSELQEALELAEAALRLMAERKTLPEKGVEFFQRRFRRTQ